MKVGCLGPKGTFSYEICNKVYNEEVEKIPYKTIKETIIALESDDVDEVVVPIENSLQGCVTETLDTLIQNIDIRIQAEQILKIQQNLMAKNLYKFEQIKEVYSHPQAIAQCRNYLENHLNQANIMEVQSTALAAKYVSQREDIACICNLECMKEYGLKLIEENIQDNDFNETKFWVLGKKQKEIQDADKMTMIFTTEHKPGALYKALSIFHKNNLNLSKIESRPAKTRLGEYYFLVDIDIDSENYIEAIKELKNVVGYYRILGKYKKGIGGE